MPLRPHPYLCKWKIIMSISLDIDLFKCLLIRVMCCGLFFVDQGTTIILWVPLILMSVVETLFSFRCFAACTSFLYLCPCRKRPIRGKRVSCRQITDSARPARFVTGSACAYCYLLSSECVTFSHYRQFLFMNIKKEFSISMVFQRGI